MRQIACVVLMSALLAWSPAYGADLQISPSDSVETVAKGQQGKRVTVRLRSGQEITGTVRNVTARLVQLGAVAGREFFDAIVPLEAVKAVLVRTKD